MVACLGDDAYGAARLTDLQREGIDATGVRQLPGVASGVALIGVDDAGQNSIIVASGANSRVTVAMAGELRCATGDVLLTQLELPLPVVATGLTAARQSGALAVLNAAPMRPDAWWNHLSEWYIPASERIARDAQVTTGQ